MTVTQPSVANRDPRIPTCVSPSCLFITTTTISSSSSTALKPVLKPPKLAPSAWQLYFTDWIQRQQASGTKLNVAQAAKEAGQEYASLSPQDKEVISIPHLLFFFLSFLF